MYQPVNIRAAGHKSLWERVWFPRRERRVCSLGGHPLYRSDKVIVTCGTDNPSSLFSKFHPVMAPGMCVSREASYLLVCNRGKRMSNQHEQNAGALCLVS